MPERHSSTQTIMPLITTEFKRCWSISCFRHWKGRSWLMPCPSKADHCLGVVSVDKGMSIGALIQPPATWKPFVHPAPKPLPKPKPWQEPQLDWADLAYERRWEDAIISYLDSNGKTLLWRVVNSVVAESRPATRSLGRSAAKEALSAMMLLIRQRRVKRHRRRWVTAVEARC
jgi:hypothetical protein